MTRCLRAALSGLAIAALAFSAAAQTVVREAPKDVKLAVIAVSTTPPIIAVNGQPDRLSPGSRIRDTRNMMVMSGALAGQSVYTVYRRDGAGLVHEVWLLTAEEYSKLGGTKAGTGDPEAVRQFNDLLNAIFLARQSGVIR